MPSVAATADMASSSPSPETGQPGATDAAAVDEITGEGDVELGPGTLDFPQPNVGLADLSSYRATLTLSFSGTVAGQPSQWSTSYVMLSSRDPLARSLSVESTGAVVDPEPIVMAESDGAAYVQRGDAPCAASVIEPGETLGEQMEPAMSLAGVFGAEEAGADVVEGVQTSRYTFDERALNEAGRTSSAGELWLAADGGHLVKYALTTTAGPDYFGDGIDGTATWAYALTDVNQALEIAVPADCPPGMLDAPLMPDATDVLNEPGVISYTTASAPADAATFYRNELGELGWQVVGDEVMVETMALIDFTKDGQKLGLIVTAGDEGTNVLLALAPIDE